MRSRGAVRGRAGWLALGLLGVAFTADAAAPPAPAAASADGPQQWLMHMNDALMKRNYDGVFAHWEGGQLETLRIIHRVENGAVTERLQSLDGSGREFVRAGDTLTCYLPDQRTVLVEHSSAASLVLGNLARLDHEMRQYYQLQSLGSTRLLGHRTRVIAVTPRDGYRYGYRLWIQESTGMPLKTELRDTRGQVIEQVVFSSLSMRRHIPDSAFRPQIAAAGFRWLRSDDAAAAAVSGEVSPLWSTAPLPPGFHLSAQTVQLLPGSPEPVEHLVFSDGIASVSVFIQSHLVAHVPAQVGPSQVGNATAQVGSSAAVTSVEEGHKYVAVGEVPQATVRFILDSLMRQSARSHLRLPGGAAAAAGSPAAIAAGRAAAAAAGAAATPALLSQH